MRKRACSEAFHIQTEVLQTPIHFLLLCPCNLPPYQQKRVDISYLDWPPTLVYKKSQLEWVDNVY